jgi:ABC-2 type transport system ATP-binding protein
MITIDHLIKAYASTTAVDDVTVEVTPGIVTGLLGPNGAGKSTMMRVVLGLDSATSGCALVAGRPYRELRRPLRTVGAHLGTRTVHPRRTGRSHLLGLARANGLGRTRVDEVLVEVGLEEGGRRRAGQYSLGMSQRLGLAAALLGDPPVLVLDEPVNGLDSDGVRWIRGLLQRLAKEGRTVLVSSHLMSEMQQAAQHVIVLGRGRLLADCATSALAARASGGLLVRSPARQQLAEALRSVGGTTVALGDEDEELCVRGMTAAQVGDLAAANRVPLHHLAPVASSLEEGYLSLVATETEYVADKESGGSA